MVLDHARLLTIGIYLALLVVTVLVMRSCKRKLDFVGWLFVALHGLLFYAVRGYDSLDGIINWTMGDLSPVNFYNLWSTVLRLHTVTVAISMLVGVHITNTRGFIKHGC
jgi:hypothetical protein